MANQIFLYFFVPIITMWFVGFIAGTGSLFLRRG